MADWRGRLHILLEGQTEEVIAREVITPALEAAGWSVSTSIITTKRPAAGANHKGGVVSWAQVDKEIRLLLRASDLRLTTMIDYYAFPSDAPGMATRPHGSAHERVRHVEQALRDHFECPRFHPHLALHETETWVFAAHEELALLLGAEVADKLRADAESAGGPELVNDAPETAPSKRLLRYCPTYLKTSDGPEAVKELGLPELRRRCPHVDEWLALFLA